MKVSFFKPALDARDEARVLDCVRSGWLTTGAVCAELEEARGIRGFAHQKAYSDFSETGQDERKAARPALTKPRLQERRPGTNPFAPGAAVIEERVRG